MPLHEILQVANSALLVFVLASMIRFHRDWSELRLMVRTLWNEREAREVARIGAARAAGARAQQIRPVS
jgi:hypothetical protein